MRRLAPAGAATVLVLATLAAGRAATPARADVSPAQNAAKAVPAAAIEQSVRSVAADVRSIDLSDAVISLRSETKNGTSVAVSLNADVLFDFGSATLASAATAEIDRIAGALRSGPVRVDGYTDSIGAQDANQTLSQNRAQAVATRLRAAGAPAGVTVTATGHGESDPVASNTRPDGTDDPVGRAKNRRVTIIYQTG
ncbi:Flagellar motor protein MotB [Frankia sp. AiPs1]|uniref:OmpA family protein n=1 Tax=Frankia sp. AiPa1 TaxID=573492 RepID=UPI00202B85DD|nr:OmpA family protein [Frankia sp. AiPa1]MCL9759327.1 OmpA family protein [Frankia sp. AiPa1]